MGCFARFTTLTQGGARSSHNAFMTVLVEQGIPGAIMFVMMALWVLRSLRAMKQQATQLGNSQTAIHAGAIGGALVVVLVGGVFADFSKCEVQIWMFALLAAITQKQMYAVPAAANAAVAITAPTPLSAKAAKGAPARRAL